MCLKELGEDTALTSGYMVGQESIKAPFLVIYRFWPALVMAAALYSKDEYSTAALPLIPRSTCSPFPHILRV